MKEELPQSWLSVKLGEIATPTRPRRNPKDFSHLPFVGMEQIQSNTGKLIGTLLAANMKSSAFHFQKNDVLYGRLRPYLNKVFWADFEGLCSSEFIVFPPSAIMEPKYLTFYLRTDGFVTFANQLNKGDRPRVSFDQIADHEIPSPPMPEQHRIVAKLEKLLGKVDVCQKRLERIPVILKRFRQSVLAAACSGRLTEDWRIENRVEQRKSIDSEEGEIPPSWKKACIGDVISELKYGTAKRCAYDKKGIPVLRIPNIINGTIDHSDLKYARLSGKQLESLRLQKGDILLIRSNGSVSLVGKSAIVQRKEIGFAYAGYLIRIRPIGTVIDPLFLNLVLASYDIRMQIEMEARSTSGVNNINSEEVRAWRFSLPTLSEQKEIVHRINGLFSFAEQIEARYQKAKAHVDKLTQSILTKAFRGELVPQNPNDESAVVMLEKIRREEEITARN